MPPTVSCPGSSGRPTATGPSRWRSSTSGTGAIAIEAELAPLRNAVLIAQVGKAFDADGRPVDPATDLALTILLDDLAWWASALRQARRAGELLPANRRRATPPAA